MEEKMDLVTKIFLSNAILWIFIYIISEVIYGKNKGLLIDHFWKWLTILSIPAWILRWIWQL